MGTFMINARTEPTINGESSVIIQSQALCSRSVWNNTQYKTMQPATPRNKLLLFFLFSSKAVTSFATYYRSRMCRKNEHYECFLMASHSFATFSSVVAQLVQMRMARWASSTRPIWEKQNISSRGASTQSGRIGNS